MRRLLLAALLLLLVQAPAARAADTGPWALFDGSTAVSDPDANDAVNVELGVRFTVDAPATGAYWLTRCATGARPTARSTPTASTSTTRAAGRSRVAPMTSPAGASGAVDVPLASPLRLTPGKTYTVSYSAPTGHYALDRGRVRLAARGRPGALPRRRGRLPLRRRLPDVELAVDELLRDAGRHLRRDHAARGARPTTTAGPWSLVTDATDIAEPVADDHQQVELGARFKVDAPDSGAYVVKAVRFYRAHAMAENSVSIYDEDRAIVARGQFLTEGGPSGLVEVKLSAPLTLRPGVEYTASYLATSGEYADEPHAFDEAQVGRPGALPAQRGRLPVRRGLPRRQLGVVELLRQPRRLARHERQQPR